jgi:histidinol-phosphatase (PHP family)
VLDYHLHLWPHSQSEAETTVEQVSAYCARAAAAGVTEIAVTEHLFRFTQAKDLLGGFWDDFPGDYLGAGMSAYWDHHARVDLDDYVEVVQAVKAEGLPVVLGLEVDFYQGRMDQVARLLADYPFDVLLGSVHWLGAWRFDVLDEPETLAEWDVRHIDEVWEEYTRAMEELAASGACDVLAHPDLVKIAGRVPAVPDEFYDRITEAAAESGMAAELSSAGWRKPLGEEYPAPPLLARFVDRGVPLTTASDAHALPDVADRVDDLRDLLARAGVPQLQGYRERRPYPVPVAPAGGVRS